MVYDEIELLIDEYIDKLPHGMEDLQKNHGITGLLLFISRRLIQPNKKEIYNNPDLLLDTINIYTDIIYRYGNNNVYPLIEEYCLFIDISRDTFYRWLNNDNNIDYSIDNVRGEKSNLTRSDTFKRISEMAREGRMRSASTGNVGGIFLCKAVDAMSEQPQQVIVSQAPTKELGTLPTFGLPQKES